MTAAERSWSVRLAATAEADFQDIVDWTFERFGDKQARVYADTLLAALEALTAGPTTVGVAERTEIAKGLFTLHVARAGRPGRHFVLFRVGADETRRSIDVLRLLHDDRAIRFVAIRQHETGDDEVKCCAMAGHAWTSPLAKTLMLFPVGSDAAGSS